MPSDLKPLRTDQRDLFVIDALDVIIKDDMPSMEYPFYSLSKDLIIYAISHVVAAFDRGQEPPKEVEIDPYAFFIFTSRGTGGREYDALRDSLDRLDGTRFRTNIKIGDKIVDQWQGLIDSASLTTNDKTGKPEKLRIALSDMVLNTIKERDVLTLNRDYFRLKRPIERRIYELARKHVGRQEKWVVNMKTLHLKTGSRSTLFEFRRSIKPLLESNHLPDFLIECDKEKDQLTFYSRAKYLKAMSKRDSVPDLAPLPEWAYEKAKKLAPGWDVYTLEASWRDYWREKGSLEIKDVGAAYLGYCKKAASGYFDNR